MFHKVIVAVDETESHHDAIALARELVDPTGQLTLAHVHVRAPLHGRGSTSGEEDALPDGSAALLADLSLADGVTATTAVASSSVGRGLHELVERERADLLVLGSTRRGLLGRVRVGDATRDAINGAPCAVAVAPAGYASGPHTMREIGVAYNDSAESRRALALAREIAAHHGSAVSVFEAVSLPTYLYTGFGSPYDEFAHNLLDHVRSRLEEICDVEVHAAFGDTVEELTTYSASVDLLLVGSRGFGPLGRLMHSSTSLRLSRTARCPLLILTRTPVASRPRVPVSPGARDQTAVGSASPAADAP